MRGDGVCCFWLSPSKATRTDKFIRLWKSTDAGVECVHVCFSVPNSQQGAPKKYRLSPLESNPSVVLI